MKARISRPIFWLAALLPLFLGSAFAVSSVKAAGRLVTPNPAGDDQWELATAADDSGHLYVLYPQLRAASDCADCRIPALTLVTSRDSGSHWDAPRPLTPFGAEQVSPQLAVDSSDRRTVYAVWLADQNQNVMLGKSSDFGQSWSVTLVEREWQDAERPVLAARGQDIYVGFARSGALWLAASHDGGGSFSSENVPAPADIKSALPDAAAVDAEGRVNLAWAGYTSKENTVRLYVSHPSERRSHWATSLMDTSRTPSDCSAYHCTWGYLGPQITLAADSAGVLYALWNSAHNSPPGEAARERIFFSSSTTRGETWSPKTELSAAPSSAKHALPVLIAGSAGVVRAGWMDSRNSPEWSTYFRSSTNGGATWSPESRIPARTLASLYAPPNSSSLH